MTLLNWTYVSKSTLGAEGANAEIETIVRQAQLKNDALQITGVLVFDGTYFAQFVEGPEASVRGLRSIIDADKRHAAVKTILYENVVDRRLTGWSLAYSGASSLVVTRAIRRALREAEQGQSGAGSRLQSFLIGLTGRTP